MMKGKGLPLLHQQHHLWRTERGMGGETRVDGIERVADPTGPEEADGKAHHHKTKAGMALLITVNGEEIDLRIGETHHGRAGKH